MNKRTNTLLYKNIPLTLYSREGDVSCVWEVSWRRGQTAAYWPKVLLTIAALLSHLGWGCSTVGHRGPKSPPSVAGSQFGILSPTDFNCNWNSLKPSEAPVPPLIYTGASLDWWLGWGSIYNINTPSDGLAHRHK